LGLTAGISLANNNNMATTTEPSAGIPQHVMAELQRAADLAAKGIRDHEAMRRSCERMDRIREENRKKLGAADIGVQIIRQSRESR
jgi:hypothetical protein